MLVHKYLEPFLSTQILISTTFFEFLSFILLPLPCRVKLYGFSFYKFVLGNLKSGHYVTLSVSQKLARPPGLRYLQSEWTLHPGSPSPPSPLPRANFVFSHGNGSLLFIKKCMKILQAGVVRNGG